MPGGSRVPVGFAPHALAAACPRSPAPDLVPVDVDGGCYSASSPVPVAFPD